jgi:hypothetical protein
MTDCCIFIIANNPDKIIWQVMIFSSTKSGSSNSYLSTIVAIRQKLFFGTMSYATMVLELNGVGLFFWQRNDK